MSSVGPERLQTLVRAPDAPDLVIVVPYRDRRSYLDIFVDRVPKYLLSRGIQRFRICVSEQATADTFNLALSRNVGAFYAICTYRPKYLVIHDVDVIPIRGIDYGPEATNVTWFLTAGSSKVLTEDFIAVNGYNPAFLGWGSEDSEFSLRLESFGCRVVEWKRRSECTEALILSLEHRAMSRADAALLSRAYWGGPPTPAFITHNDPEYGVHLDRQYDKRRGFYDEDQRFRNLRLYEAVRRLLPESRRSYFASAGLNLLNLEKLLQVNDDGLTSRVTYDPRSVMNREAPSIAEFDERPAG